MELQIFNPTEDNFLKVIEWNHEEIKQEVAQKVEQYKNLVYTDSEIKEAKIDRANLNKFIVALESKRKEVKKKCLEPYERFEKQMKEIIAIVKEPIALIDKQIKEVEEIKHTERKAKILEYFEQNIKELKGILSFEKVFKPSYLNTGRSLKSIEEEIKETIEQVVKDIETIESLSTKYELQVKDYYIRTLDLSMALRENTRLLQLEERERNRKETEIKQVELKQKMLEEKEIESRTREETQERIESNVETEKIKEESQSIIREKKYMVGLNVTGTREQLDLFCKFLNINHIQYEVKQKPQLIKEDK